MSQEDYKTLPGHKNGCYFPSLMSWVSFLFGFCLFSLTFISHVLAVHFRFTLIVPHIHILCHKFTMSQNEALSSATRPTFSPAYSPELSEVQKQTINKCTAIIQEFQSGNISKPKASVLLQQIIPHSDTKEDTFISTYESYFNILNNFEQY